MHQKSQPSSAHLLVWLLVMNLYHSDCGAIMLSEFTTSGHPSYKIHETDMHKLDFKRVLCREGCCLNLQMANTGENDEAQATACKQNEGKPTWCGTGYWNTVVIRHTPRRACKETWAFAPMSLDKEHCFCRGHLLLLFNVLYRIRCLFIKAPLGANAVLETSWEVLWLWLLLGAWQLRLCHSALSSTKRFCSEAAVDVSVLRSAAIQQQPFKFYVQSIQSVET